MLDDGDFNEDLTDPELALLRLEAKLRSRVEQALSESNSGEFSTSVLVDYMNHVLALIDSLEIDDFEEFSVPTERDAWDQYTDFGRAMARFRIRVHIARSRGHSPFSIALSGSDKEKVRHFVEQIKTILDSSNLAADKKEALFKKLNDFLAAVDKDRTQLQALSDFVMSIARTTSDVAVELEPVWTWVKRVAQLFGVKVDEQATALPPTRRSRLPAPQRRLPSPKKMEKDLDDDIPF